MKSIGVLINKLDRSQKSVMVMQSLNRLAKTVPCNVFFLDFAIPPFSNLFSILSAREAYSFDGTLISTDEETARIALNSFSPAKYFYIWDLEWTYEKGKKHEDLSLIYQHDSLQLICRSEQHAKIVESCWKKPHSVFEGFDHERLQDLL